MVSILYEHPLNERIRNYLKLEQLFAQVANCEAQLILDQHQVFFTTLFTIIDTLDRNDVRGDLIKDLEKLEQNLVLWSQSPEINSSALDENLQQAVSLICQLKAANPRSFQFKDDIFLNSLKQRFAIQGGSSSFDLPQLNFWLHQEPRLTANDMTTWLQSLELINQSVALVLKFIRQRSDFEKITTDSGFYQDNGEGLLLLRIKLPQNANYYPTVSGNRFRYSIRFMHPCEDKGRKFANHNTSFELSRC
ncbi:MAG: cell division protein ZapD [Thalassotalea sp.]